jgi:hypothetical protein
VNSRVEISVVAGTTYFVKAAAYQRSTGAYTLDFQTVADVTAPTTPITPITPISPITPATPVSSEFQIDVTLTGFSGAQQQIIQQAVDRWEQIIVGDLPDVNYLGRVIDDLAISITSIRIDGNGGILGQSSATAFRSGSELPYLGFIQLDTADVARMQSNGSLLGVVEHEIAHVLGFGVIWSDLGLVVGASTSAPGFSGVNAVAEYNAIFGTNVMAVPVEAGGGAGTSERVGSGQRIDDRLVQRGSDESHQPHYRGIAGRPGLSGQHVRGRPLQLTERVRGRPHRDFERLQLRSVIERYLLARPRQRTAERH